MAGGWRLAGSLEKLRSQVNSAYPNRSKISDGTIGDAAHAASASDHNPNAAGVVCALDLTHDPANGFDAHALADRLRVNRHPNLKYIISNSRICGEWTGWQWWDYQGINPHSSHVHFSVGVGADGASVQPYDNQTEWNIKEDNMDLQTAKDIAFWSRLVSGSSEKKANEANKYDSERIAADPAYAVSLLKALYQENELMRWKATNYDSEVKRLKDELEKATTTGFVKITDLYIKK